MPFRLAFPSGLLAAAVAASLLAAGLGAALPVQSLLGRPIARVLKGM
jgi:hypothetical protein